MAASSKKKLRWFWPVFIVLVFVITCVVMGILYAQSMSGRYVAVYMTTGDVYYGKINWFPEPTLRNVWFLDRTTTESSTQVGVTPFVSVFWGPVDEMHLNRKQIIFWTYLANNSPVLRAMMNAAAATSTGASAGY